MSPRARRPRHTVTVTIGGEKHVLRSDAPPEYTRAVAEHVDTTVKALGDAQPLETHRVAILAALFITDELFRARKELSELREELAQRADGVAERLEKAVRSVSLQPADASAQLPAAPGSDAVAASGAAEAGIAVADPAPDEPAATEPPAA